MSATDWFPGAVFIVICVGVIFLTACAKGSVRGIVSVTCKATGSGAAPLFALVTVDSPTGGFITSAANPYAVVFFAALFPQFIDPTQPIAAQVAILGATYIVIDGAILVAMGATATQLMRILGSRMERWVSMISGAGLLAAAALLALRGTPEPATGGGGQ